MSGAKWTPGPLIWMPHRPLEVWEETSPGVGGPDPQPPEGEKVAEFSAVEYAQLFALVLEMAELLEEFLELAEGDGFRTLEVCDRAASLLRKAKGEAS